MSNKLENSIALVSQSASFEKFFFKNKNKKSSFLHLQSMWGPCQFLYCLLLVETTEKGLTGSVPNCKCSQPLCQTMVYKAKLSLGIMPACKLWFARGCQCCKCNSDLLLRLNSQAVDYPQLVPLFVKSLLHRELMKLNVDCFIFCFLLFCFYCLSVLFYYIFMFSYERWDIIC